MSEPLRRCVGCGRNAPQRDLQRFTARDGELVPSAEAPGQQRTQGRGAYTCRRLACFERARAKGGFARALRQGVRVDPTLSRLYTYEEANG
jgi:predicted RNA-binding protein YlxR (DUF448 family)